MKKLSGYTLLVVDDDPILLELLADDFRNAGGNVDIALNGQIAIQMISQKKYDFVLSDMRMPDGNGRFLASKILELHGQRPLFFLYSGFNDLTTKESMDLGITESFSKPQPFEKIIDSIHKHIKNQKS